MAQIGKVEDIMTREVMVLHPDDSLDSIAKLFEEFDYDGLPVVDPDRKLLGIITEYDMVSQSLGMHLPTVVAILDKISVDRADKKDLSEHFRKLREIKAKQVMNTEALTVTAGAGLEEAAKLFAEHHRVNPLCVVNSDGKLVGVLSRYDVIRFFNEKYFQQIVHASAPVQSVHVDKSTRSGKEIESAVGDIYKEFLLVGKRRPIIWKVIAGAAFIAGLIAATALIIRLVRKDETLNLRDNTRIVLSTSVLRERV